MTKKRKRGKDTDRIRAIQKFSRKEITSYKTQEYLGFGAPNYGSICRNTDGKLYTHTQRIP